MENAARDVCERLCSLGQPGTNSDTQPLRLLVVLAHPDDEVLALGGRLDWLRGSSFATVTNGVPQDGADARDHGFASLAAYGRARRQELAAALAHAGLPAGCAFPLVLADGGSVPDQRAAFLLPAIARAVTALLQGVRPEAVLTHPYEGGHPDHDACAFAVHTAVRCAGLGVPIVEAPFYHAVLHDATVEPGMATGSFLPGDPGCTTRLSPQQEQAKRERLRCFASQQQTLQAFGTAEERYRPAPDYDFAQRPHAGTLHYEQYQWGITGDEFCERAMAALRELGC